MLDNYKIMNSWPYGQQINNIIICTCNVKSFYGVISLLRYCC